MLPTHFHDVTTIKLITHESLLNQFKSENSILVRSFIIIIFMFSSALLVALALQCLKITLVFLAGVFVSSCSIFTKCDRVCIKGPFVGRYETEISAVKVNWSILVG